MRFEYVKPELDIINLSDEDIIITSNTRLEDGGDQDKDGNQSNGDFGDYWG